MNKKTRKHNIRVYTESVENAKKHGGAYIMQSLDFEESLKRGYSVGKPLPKDQQYLIDLANEKMKRKNKASKA